MKNLKYLFLAVAGFAALFSSLAMAEEQIVLQKNKALPLCQELEQILNLPENKGYITADIKLSEAASKKFGHKLFHIPKDRKNFSTAIAWQSSSEEEFKKAVPQEYKKLKESRTDQLPPMHVEKKLLDVVNTGDPRMIYKVDMEGYYHHQFYMEERENDPISEGFNSHVSGGEVFFYKGRAYFSGTNHFMGIGFSQPTFIRSIDQMSFVEVCNLSVEK